MAKAGLTAAAAPKSAKRSTLILIEASRFDLLGISYAAEKFAPTPAGIVSTGVGCSLQPSDLLCTSPQFPRCPCSRGFTEK